MSASIILITIVCYFCIHFGISWLAGRKADNAGFFSGGRKNNWFAVALSTIGAPISAVTFVSVPGMVAGSGMSYMQMVIGFTIGQALIAFVLIPMYYRMNLTSIYEYLNQRFGVVSYKTGAWVFFASKSTGAAVRLFIVCEVLQLLVMAPLGVPHWANIIITCSVVYITTFRGGVKSVVWTDVLKTVSLLTAIGLCLYEIAKSGVFGGAEGGFWAQYKASEMTRIFFFDDVTAPRYFWKQVVAGIVILVAMTGLDQDMMQRTLSCKNYKDSQKNIMVGATVQIVVIWLLLVLGFMLYTYAEKNGVSLAGMKGDDVFAHLATGGYFPAVVGVLFVVGFISSGYTAAGGSLTALTTSFTIDILGRDAKSESTETKKARTWVHAMMTILLAVMVEAIYLLNNESVINTVYRVASYTYGPLLGMFFFGILSKRQVRDQLVPAVGILAPVLTFVIDYNAASWLNGYTLSHERLLLNAVLTFAGMWLISHPAHKEKTTAEKPA